MARVFRSDRGMALVHEKYLSLLRDCPLSCEEIRLPTCEGETFVLACGRPAAPPLVLFHGGSTTSAMWLGDLPVWAEHFRVYAVDMIGEPGFSAPSRPPLKTEDHAFWLDDVWIGLGISRAPIVGASQGGWLALDYAIRRQPKVQSLVLLAPGGISRQRIGMSLKVAPLLLLGSWGRRKAVNWAMGLQRNDLTAEYEAFFNFFLLTQAHFAYRMNLLPVFTDEMLGILRLPILAIVGGKDVAFRSAETRRRLKTCVPQSRVIYLPEAGHGLQDHASTILDFLLKEGSGARP